jgi:alkylhydroperoxidase/carboxymuconolactone decarboxylase family protein YurZ
LLTFATAVNDCRGAVTAEQIDAVRAAGASDEEIAETIGHVALNVLTNFFNKGG